MEIATFGAGCFWGVEHVYRQLRGVVDTAAGYSGGDTDAPTYADVCTNATGHAEVVRLTYDPAAISYEQLLDVFWQCHDPTQRDRQGEDLGSQYRSIIFWHTPYQRDAAEKSRDAIQTSGQFSEPVATIIEPAADFHRAEEHHQRYVEKNGAGACQIACPVDPSKQPEA